MKNLDAKSAADEIHLAVNAALANDHPSPEERHTLAYVTAVCGHLGLEPTSHHVAVVTDALAKADIVPNMVKDYPKFIGRRALVGSDGQPLHDEYGRPQYEDVIAHNEDEESAWSKETHPMLDREGKPMLDAKGDARSHEVMVQREGDPAVLPARTVIGGPYPKLVGRRRIYGADRQPLRDQYGADRMQDVIVNSEEEETEWAKSLIPAPVAASERPVTENVAA